MVTGLYDDRPLEWSTEVKQEMRDSDASTTFTKSVHIFPQSTAMISGVDAKDTKV
jgi:hypothetical protein